MSLNVVFTGPAVDHNGQRVIREDLISTLTRRGWTVANRVQKGRTKLLVASRDDTVKAAAAKKLGIHVMTYQDFFQRFLSNVQIVKAAKADPFVDTQITNAVDYL